MPVFVPQKNTSQNLMKTSYPLKMSSSFPIQTSSVSKTKKKSSIESLPKSSSESKYKELNSDTFSSEISSGSTAVSFQSTKWATHAVVVFDLPLYVTEAQLLDYFSKLTNHKVLSVFLKKQVPSKSGNEEQEEIVMDSKDQKQRAFINYGSLKAAQEAVEKTDEVPFELKQISSSLLPDSKPSKKIKLCCAVKENGTGFSSPKMEDNPSFPGNEGREKDNTHPYKKKTSGTKDSTSPQQSLKSPRYIHGNKTFKEEQKMRQQGSKFFTLGEYQILYLKERKFPEVMSLKSTCHVQIYGVKHFSSSILINGTYKNIERCKKAIDAMLEGKDCFETVIVTNPVVHQHFSKNVKMYMRDIDAVVIIKNKLQQNANAMTPNLEPPFYYNFFGSREGNKKAKKKIEMIHKMIENDPSSTEQKNQDSLSSQLASTSSSPGFGIPYPIKQDKNPYIYTSPGLSKKTSGNTSQTPLFSGYVSPPHEMLSSYSNTPSAFYGSNTFVNSPPIGFTGTVPQQFFPALEQNQEGNFPKAQEPLNEDHFHKKKKKEEEQYLRNETFSISNKEEEEKKVNSSFNENYSKKNHVEEEEGTKDFVEDFGEEIPKNGFSELFCSVCRKYFESKDELNQHLSSQEHKRRVVEAKFLTTALSKEICSPATPTTFKKEQQEAELLGGVKKEKEKKKPVKKLKENSSKNDQPFFVSNLYKFPSTNSSDHSPRSSKKVSGFKTSSAKQKKQTPPSSLENESVGISNSHSSYQPQTIFTFSKPTTQTSTSTTLEKNNPEFETLSSKQKKTQKKPPKLNIYWSPFQNNTAQQNEHIWGEISPPPKAIPTEISDHHGHTKIRKKPKPMKGEGLSTAKQTKQKKVASVESKITNSDQQQKPNEMIKTAQFTMTRFQYEVYEKNYVIYFNKLLMNLV